MNNYELNWSDLAFESKKPLKVLKATFILAPREMSKIRFTQIIKEYLPTGNIVVGFAEQDYINGFDGQPQFMTLKYDDVREIISKVNNSKSPNKITALFYDQSAIMHILDKVHFKKVLLVNGSWQFSFHLRPEFYTIALNNIPIEFISPFASEDEALEYAEKFKSQTKVSEKPLTEVEMMRLAGEVAKHSFDTTHQTGVVLGKRLSSGKYKPLLAVYNKVVPFETFAWHFGASREKHKSQPGDLNHYDTVHCENLVIIEAQKKKMDIKNTTLFINLLPCPTCARMLCEAEIDEIVYTLDHSNGYAVALLEKAGKKVRRLIDSEILL